MKMSRRSCPETERVLKNVSLSLPCSIIGLNTGQKSLSCPSFFTLFLIERKVKKQKVFIPDKPLTIFLVQPLVDVLT